MEVEAEVVEVVVEDSIEEDEVLVVEVVVVASTEEDAAAEVAEVGLNVMMAMQVFPKQLFRL